MLALYAVNELGEHSKLTQDSVLGQEAIKGNEKADALAKKGTSKSFIELIPLGGTCKEK